MSPVPYTVKETLLYTDRRDWKVELFFIHETAGGYPGDLNHLIGSRLVSCNWFIDRAGNIICLDPKFRATAHAGPCRWGKYTENDGIRGPDGKLDWGWANLMSESIEVSGPNDGTPFTPAQVDSLLALTRWRTQVYSLDRSRVVRHRDLCWPQNPLRKSDPRGLNWPAFQAALQPAPQPIGQVTIGGPGGKEFHCDRDFKTFYDAHGGILLFGFATGDQYTMADELGEACAFMNFENVVLKRKPSMPESWRLRPVQLADAVTLGLGKQ